MKYLLDTCTVSDFVKGQPNVLARVKATPPNLIGVSALTRMEVDYGLARGLAVVTSNAGEFKRVSGLQVEDWR